LTDQCRRVMSGMTTWSREPSGSIASTMLRYHPGVPTVVVYARISQDRQKDGAGVERQVADCRALAERLGLGVLETIRDNDRSAYRIDKPRPGWDRVIMLAEAGEIDGVVVWHTDRLYRHPMQLEQLAVAIEHSGLTIHTCTAGEVDLNTPSGRMAARMFGAAARQEVEHKAERQARKHTAIAEAGAWQGGRRPLGYMADGVTVNEAEAPALREAARMIMAGESLAAATRHVSRAWGRDVKGRVVRDVLTAPRIAGLRMHWPVADRQRYAKRGGDKKVTLTQAKWPGLITYEEWTTVKAILLDPRRRSGGGRPTKSLLGGLLCCSACGRGLGYSTSSYKCMRSVGGCGRVSVSTASVERLVLEEVEAVLSETHLDFTPPPTDSATTTARARLQATYDDLLPLWREGVITSAELARERAELKARLSTLDEVEDASLRKAATARSVATSVEAWQQASQTARRQTIQLLTERIEVKPATKGKASGCKFDSSRIRIVWAG
jgi:site-specific DNA recombinase